MSKTTSHLYVRNPAFSAVDAERQDQMTDLEAFFDYMSKKRALRKSLEIRRAKQQKEMEEDIRLKNYCDNPRNVEYWKQMGNTKDSKEAKEFLKYIQEVPCDEESS